MIQVVKLNEEQVQSLREMVEKDSVSKAVLKDFSGRLRTRKFVNIGKQVARLDLKPNEVTNTYKALENLGVGKIENNQFKPISNLRLIGGAAMNIPANKLPREKRRRRKTYKYHKKEVNKKQERKVVLDESSMLVVYPIGNKYFVFKLLRDITQEEADVLASFIKETPKMK